MHLRILSLLTFLALFLGVLSAPAPDAEDVYSETIEMRSAEAEAEPVSEPVAEADPAMLFKRACDYTTGCRSLSGATAGKYCGYCYEVRTRWVSTHIYQLNGGSGASACCDYGYSNACAAQVAAGTYSRSYCPQ